MATVPAPRQALGSLRGRAAAGFIQRQGGLLALVLVVVVASLRYSGFLTKYNIENVLLSNEAKFGLIALGMTFVIITGGIDLSVGSVAALGSVMAAKMSSHGTAAAILVPVAVGIGVGVFNGVLIAYGRLMPFVVTLATLLGARGLALHIAGNQSVGISFDNSYATLSQKTFLGLPLAVDLLIAAYVVGMLVLRYARFGRNVLAIGGNEEAARLMGLPIRRTIVSVYALSGGLAALAGVVLATQTFSGQPTAGVGWELTAIAAVVVGGTLLTGGMGSIGGTLVGVLLLGSILNVLNFENGRGTISLSSYWQTVIRGVFLLIVVVLQARLARRVRT